MRTWAGVAIGRSPLLTLAVAVGLFSGCAKKSPPDPRVLAKVGSREIRVEDFQREAEWRQKSRRHVADKQALLDEMILSEALLQRAQSAGLDTDPQLQREIRNLIIGKLLDRELTSRQDAVTVSAEEVKAAYEQNLAKHTRPAKVRLAGLFLEADKKMSDTKRAEVKARMQEAHRLAAASASAPHGTGQSATRTAPPLAPPKGEEAYGFGTLALNYSDDQSSRYRGGDIGWLDAGASHSRWPKAVIEAGFALEKGQLSDVLEAEGGFYVIMKTDFRERSVTPFEHVEASLRQSLVLKKRQEIDQAYRKAAVARVPVQLHQEALATVELPAAPAAVAQYRELPAMPGLNVSKRGN